MNKDFLSSVNKIDFIFLTETWSNTHVDIPGFWTFVSDTSAPQADKACRISGGITLLYKAEGEKHVSIAKKSKNFL